MEPILVILLIIAALAVMVVWACIYVLTKLVRLVIWGVSTPVRVVRSVSRSSAPVDPTLMRCGNDLCGAPLPHEARFCPRCGTGIRRSPARLRVCARVA